MTIRSSGISRRGFLGSASAFGLACAVAPAFAQSYGIDAAPMALPAADGPLRWLDSGDQKAVFFRAFFEQYSTERGIEVIYDGLPWTEIATVVPLGVRNNSAPDAFALPQGMAPSVAIGQGWVRPLDDLIPDFEAWKAGFPAGSFIEGVNMLDGKTYGLPSTSDRRSSSLLLFGKAAMALTDFDPNSETPLSWEDMRSAARQITEKSGGSTFGWIIGGAQVGRWSANVLQMAQRAGAVCGVEGFTLGLDPRSGEIVVDSDEMVAAVELLLAMRDDGSAFPGVLSLNAPQARAFVAQGNAGMILQGPWNVPIWEANNPDFDFGFTYTPGPAGATGKTYINTVPSPQNMMFINANAKNPSHAADVFRIMGTVDGQTAWANVVGASDPAIFPEANARADLSERSRQVIALQEDQVRALPVPYARNAGFVAVARLYQEPTPNLAQTIQGLYAGQLTGVQATLSALKDEMNTALDTAIDAANAEGAGVSRDQLVFADWDPATDYSG